MKYFKKEIIEDKHLFDGWTLGMVSKVTGFSRPYISRVRSGLLVISEKEYQKFKKILAKYRDK